jgi:allantoinase
VSAPGTTIVRGGSVVTPDGVQRVDISIVDGQISGLPATGGAASATGHEHEHEHERTIDATGMLVLPGAIDGHTHFIQDDPKVATPDPDEFEGFWDGGRAAAGGGVTCVVEMPHATPPTIDRDSFERKRELAEADALVDFALWGGVVQRQATAALSEQIAAGAAGLKAYMCGSDPLLPGVDDARLVEAMSELADTPLLIGLHAENDALLSAGLARMQAEGRRDPLAHADSRPALVEHEAVARAILFGRHTGAHVHIVHLSTAAAAECVRAAKREGARVTAETCPHYLLLAREDLERLAGYARCAPPLRTRADVEALWEALADGTLDCVTSDHCAFTAESKARGAHDIWQAPNGLPGVQTMLPVIISEGRRRGLAWEQIAELTATAPARLWGLAPRKGSIAIGADADLAIVDPDASWDVRGKDMLGAHSWTPFEGLRLQGRIVRTLRRGDTVYEHGAAEPVKGSRGSGRFVAAHRA